MADVTCSDGKTVILPNENDEKNVSTTIIPFEMPDNQKFGLKIQSATKQIANQQPKIQQQQKPKQIEMKLTSDNKSTSNVNSCIGVSLDGVGVVVGGNNNKISNSNLNKNENVILMPPAIKCIDKKIMSGISGLKKILPKNVCNNKSNNTNTTKIGLPKPIGGAVMKMPQNATATPTAAPPALVAVATAAAVSAKKVDNKTKAGPQTPCQDADDDSRAKKRCSDRYDSSESSDSGVATLSCTDSSTASSDASDPGSPYSPGSIGEDTHQLLKSNMTPQILQAAQIQQHQSNSIKTQWPWNTSKTVNNNNNVKAINNNTNISTGNKLKRLSSHSVNDAVATAKKLRTAGNSGDKLSASLIGGSNNVGSNAKRLKTAPEETQQTKITGYFKSQMKPLNSLKKEISNLVARSSIEAQSAAGGLDKYFNILAKAKDDKDQSTAHGIKKDFELDVRTLTTMSTPSLKKIERKTTTKVAQVAPMTRKTNTTLPTSNLNGKSPKKHVAIAPRTSEVKKTQANSIRKGTNGNMQQIDNLKSTQPTVLLTAIRIPASIHQTSGVATLSSNGPTKIAPKPQPSQTLSNAVTSSTSLNTSPNKVNPLFQIPVMPNLVQIPNLITTSRANLVMNNGQLTRMGNSTQYFVNGTVIKVQQIGGTTNGVTNGNSTSSMLSMESGLTSNILLKQATIAQTVPFSTVATTTKAALPIQQQPLSITSQSLSSQTIPTIQSSLSSGSQTSVTTTSLGNQSFVSNGSSSRIQPQSVFMATSAGLLLNATLPAVITTSKLPGLNQPLPALHPIQQPSTQSTNILPSINTILQSSHHPHSAQLTTSVAPQIIVSQSHQSLVNISPPALSSIANTNGVTRSQQQSLPPLAATTSSPPEIIAPKLSEPPSLRLISNTVSDILTSTTTTTTFTSTLTSWSKQIAETIQNDSEKTIRRESFKPSISLREPVLPPLLPITLPTLPPPLPPVSIAPVVAATTIKCENKTTKDLDSIKLATKPTEPPLIWVKTASELPASPKLSPPDDKEDKEDIAESSLPTEPKGLILEDKEEKPSPDVFKEEKEEEKLNLAEEVKPTILKEVITNDEDKLNDTEEHNDVEHNDSTEIEIEPVKANGIDLSAVEVDIDLVNKTTSSVNGCAKSPILSQPKTIRFPALKSDSNFRFGPKGTKRHDGVCYWDNCNQKYDTCSKLLDHLQTQHVNTQTGPYSCLWSGCKVHGRESCSRRWLERHALSHGGTKPFKCIVDGCGLRFGSQLALQKHVNGHFNTTENKDNPNKRTSDPPVPKLLRKNGKKLRYRRQPFSARLFDFFDSGVMEGLQHRLMVTGLLASGPKGSVTFQGRTMARRVTFEGKPEIFVRWSPSDIIPDEWIPETHGKITKDVIIHSMGSQELIALQKYLGIAYLKPDLNTLYKEEPTSIAVALNNSLARTNNRKHLRKPPKQTAQPS